MPKSRKQPRTKRQQRKAEARAKGVAFMAMTGDTHPHGPRRMRRRRYHEAKGKGIDRWRVNKAWRGERHGRALERLIRAGAPLHVVNREKILMRALLA